MLGEKIYSLRKNSKISQEEFAEFLNTSRQAVSKWERNEAKPDIDKLIIISKIFNISIDYLLDYEINNSNVDDFIKELELCSRNNDFSIDINDIRLWCSKYTNNFKLHVNSSEYLFIAYIENSNKEYLDLSLFYINKAIKLFTLEYNDIISLNDLHKNVSHIYMMQNNYKQAKDYLQKNNVSGCNELIAKCDLALKNYDNALEISSQLYLKSVSNIMNSSFIQMMVLLKKKKIQEAYDLGNWAISFIKSIKNDDSFFIGILCPFLFLTATCEQLLNINNKETMKKLKQINDSTEKISITSKTSSIKYYFGKSDELLLIDSTVQKIFKSVIDYTSKEDIYYLILLNIYEEILGEKYYE